MKFLKNKKILITGGTGFIGSRLINELTKAECKIYLMVRQNNKLVNKIKNKKIRVLKGNLVDINFWKKNIREKDFLIHLASDESKFGSKIDVVQNFNINVKSIFLALFCAQQLNKKIKIISIGSENQLGIAKKIPVNEEINDNPVTIFGINKLIAEKYSAFFKKNFNIKIVNLRLSNVYGPSGLSSNFFKVSMNKMIKNISGGKIFLYKNKNSIRDFVYIDDVINAIILSMKKINKLKSVFYYIGSGKGYSLKKISEMIMKIIVEIYPNKEIITENITKKISKFDKRNFVANYKKFQQATGWTPKTSLKKGISITIAKIT